MSERTGLMGARGAVLAGAGAIAVAVGVAWFSGVFTPDVTQTPTGALSPSTQTGDAAETSPDKAPDKADDTVVVVQDVSEQQDAPQDQTAQPGASDGERSEEAPIAQASDTPAPVDPLKDETVPRNTEVEAGQIAQDPSEPATDPATDEAAQDEAPLAQASTPVEQTDDAPVPPTPMPPRIDLVRVEPDGSATIAGRGEPNTEIVTELDGQEIGRVTATSDGSFVQFLSLPIAQVPQMIRLWVVLPEGGRLYALEDAILAPAPVAETSAAADPQEVLSSVPVETPVTAQEAGEVSLDQDAEQVATQTDDRGQTDQSADLAAMQKDPVQADEPKLPETKEADTVEIAVQDVVEPEAAPSINQVAEDVITSQSQVTPSQESPIAVPVLAEDSQVPVETPDPPRAPMVLLAGQEGMRVVQQTEAPPEVMSAVALDTITYSEDGEVQLSGRARGNGFVRVYIDNKAITTSRISADGGWRTDLPDVDTGIYTLRVDEIDDAGQVTSRVETPFKREAQAVVAEAGQVSAITVQPGNTLWAIARENYGEGILYVRLYQANKDRIRNPDLIYPGQVFDIPRE